MIGLSLIGPVTIRVITLGPNTLASPVWLFWSASSCDLWWPGSAVRLADRCAAPWLSLLRLENLCRVRLALLGAGVLGSAFAVEAWSGPGFGQFSNGLQLVLPSATAITLGVSLLCGGLAGSYLGHRMDR